MALLRSGSAALRRPGHPPQRIDRGAAIARPGFRTRSRNHPALSRRLIPRGRSGPSSLCQLRVILPVMNLERITVEFHAEDDRLMVRVFFDKKAEIQFWL